MKSQSFHYSLSMLKHERRGMGKGGTRDRGLNQKYLEFCKYFYNVFYKNISLYKHIVKTVPRVMEDPISVKYQISLYVNP